MIGGIHERRDPGLDGFRKGGMQDCTVTKVSAFSML